MRIDAKPWCGAICEPVLHHTPRASPAITRHEAAACAAWSPGSFDKRARRLPPHGAGISHQNGIPRLRECRSKARTRCVGYPRSFCACAIGRQGDPCSALVVLALAACCLLLAWSGRFRVTVRYPHTTSQEGLRTGEENSTEVPASWVESLSLEEQQKIRHQGRITWGAAVWEYPDKMAAWLLSRRIGTITKRDLKKGSEALKGIGVTVCLDNDTVGILWSKLNPKGDDL